MILASVREVDGSDVIVVVLDRRITRRVAEELPVSLST